MFNPFKKKENPDKNYFFKWYDIGIDNPFNKRILDCRSFTQTMLSTTKDISIASKFNQLRTSTGLEYSNFEISNKKTIVVDLTYPHNGAQLEGVVFKASCMEEKWDIYVYNNCFYFTRSWTGELVYKAFSSISNNEIRIYKIEYTEIKNEENSDSLVSNNVHFLIMTHAIKKIFPHKVPNGLKTEMEIATYSFAQFGKICWYATYEDILNTTVKTRETNSKI